MTTVTRLQYIGTQFSILFSDGSSIIAINKGAGLYIPVSTNIENGVDFLRVFGDQISIHYSDNTQDLAIPVSNELWYVNGSYVYIPPVVWEWPLNTSIMQISSPYGPRTVPYTGFHAGIDITRNGITGTPIWAISNATVILVSYNGSAGNYCTIRHSADDTTSVYMHMIAPPIVSVGQSINRGDVLGNVGATGDATGPHLHFETHEPASTTVDPILFMRARGHEFGEVQTS